MKINANLFWSKVDIDHIDKCWNWKAYTKRDGYGNFPIGQKRWNAHRVAYMLTFGEIEKGMLVCHTCDNPSCVNPNHLFLGTHKDNTQDALRKNRLSTHKLSPKQIEYIRRSNKKPKELAKELGVSGRAIANHR